ncbi:MAG: response regulator [Saprospiraceae bacterium]|nr:response regulator [Saprospiraceae bacterium]
MSISLDRTPTHLIYRWALWIILIGIPFLSTTQNPIHPIYSHLTINEGLSQSLIYSITQDSEGFMWFGTKDGLSRYDGYTFRNYYHDPFDTTTLSGNTITGLFTDSKGYLWVGTMNNGLNLYVANTDRFIHIITDGLENASIRNITEDHQGNLWVGTFGNGLFKLIFGKNTRSKPLKVIHFTHKENDASTLNSNYVNGLFVDHSGILWVSTLSGIFQTTNPAKDNISFSSPILKIVKARRTEKSGIQLYDPNHTIDFDKSKIQFGGEVFVEDDARRLWIGTNSGLFLFSQKENKLIYFEPPGWGPDLKNILCAVYIYSKNLNSGNQIWMGLFKGLGIFDTRHYTLQLIKYEPGNPQSILPDNVISIYRDRSGCVWLGSNGYGLSKFNPRTMLFATPVYEARNHEKTSSDLSIRSFLDTKENLYIGTSSGMWQVDKASGIMKNLTFSTDNPISDLIFSILPSNEDEIWVGSSSGLYLLNIKTGSQKIFKPRIEAQDEEDNRIYKILDAGNGTLWCLTPYSFSKFKRQTGTFEHYFFQQKIKNKRGEPTFGEILPDMKGNFWLGTGEGLFYFDTHNKTFRHFFTNPSDPNSLSYNAVRSMVFDKQFPQKYLWIGTAGGGLNRLDLNTFRFKHFTVREGLPNNVIYGILRDSKGDLWMSTNNGISRFNPVISSFQNYDIQSGLQSNEFNSGAFYANKDGKFFFGGIKGFNAFFPEEIKNNNYIPPIVFTSFRIAEKRYTIPDSSGLLTMPIWKTKNITLPYKDNSISFEVAGLDFSNSGNIYYAYRLEPGSKTWIPLGTNRIIAFSNLNPGNYLLHVRAANIDRKWNNQVKTIQFTIKPPWWKTIPAYILYLFITIFILYLIRKYELKRIELRNRLKVESLESQKLKELDHLKSRFFANISHEFRTPLTLIIGPLEDILREGNTEKFRSLIPEMHRNSKRLLQLINQLLDLSKIDADKYVINTTRADIIPFVEMIIHTFSSMAERKNIALETKLDNQLKDILNYKKLWFDEDIVEKVLFNLMSNAIKFTPNDGKITVNLGLYKNEDKFIEVNIEDNGIGIPQDKISQLFDRFYQVNDHSSTSQSGSGIGLALAKELIELHQGKIFARSKPGKGSIFTFILPFDFKKLTEYSDHSSISSEEKSKQTIISETNQINDSTKSRDGNAEDKPLILVVEDHTDVRKYIAIKLEDEYQILEAENGKEGLKTALERLPDLVISDVMMPEMDGFELCAKLKTNHLTSHIPVILLTARAEDKDRLEGLETGADAYLIKPFNTNELKIIVKNQIELRNLMRMKFNDKLIVKPSEITITSVDREFIQKLLSQVETHLGDAQLSVSSLSGAVNMSVSQLTRKLKALINQTPQQFIRSIRMQRALELLKNKAGNIAEISIWVGFEDPGYFTKVFKQHFGQLPSEVHDMKD